MDSELLDLFNETITVEPPTGTYTDGGKKNYGAAVPYACKIDPAPGEQIIYGPDREERRASWTIYVVSTTAINPEGRLTLPAGFDPQQPPFMSVARYVDEVGVHHYVISV